MPTNITFQTYETGQENPLKLWQIGANTSDIGKHFAIIGNDDDDEVIWSNSLPGGMKAAQQWLNQARAHISKRQRATGIVGKYLQLIEDPSSSRFSYDLGQVNLLTEEESILLATLANNSSIQDESASLSFDWLSRWRKNISQFNNTANEYLRFINQVGYLLKPTIWVQTKIDQSLLAQTLLQAGGDLATVWHGRRAPTQFALHHENLQLTLETRQALALFLAQISAGAISLSSKFSVAQWIALPTAFRFAQDIIHRAKEDRLLERLRKLQIGEE